MQKENPVANSVHQIKISCAKYKFAERSHNFLMQLPIQLVFGDRWDLDKLQTCVKWKSILEFRSCERKSKKIQKNKIEQKSFKTWFDRTTLWRVYVYLISSTSMQKENPVANSVCYIKIRFAKNKFAKQSHNFIMQLLMQLIFGDRWDLDKLQICVKGKSILEFRSCEKKSKKSKKIK